MYQLRNFRRHFVIVVVLAMLYAALSPTFAYPMQTGAGLASAQMPICSANAGLDGSAGQPSDGTVHLRHCPSCLLHATIMAPPPSAWSVPSIRIAVAAPFPPLFYSAPRPLFVYSSAHPRAPPALP